MTDYLSLAARVEEATGPDRELDAAIGNAVNAIPLMICDTGNVEIFAGFTASLDAALSLAPRGRALLVLERAIATCLLATNHRSDDFVRRLPAFVTASALRVLAADDAK